MSGSELTVCPNCGKPLSGFVPESKRRWHLDSKCLTKKQRIEKQKQAKIQPDLPLRFKGK